MSEIINNSRKRIDELKSLLKQLNEGKELSEVREELTGLLGQIPYGDVVQAEQELIEEGMPVAEIQKYCDVHSEALKDKIDLSFQKHVPEGHPVSVMRQENLAISDEVAKLTEILINLSRQNDSPYYYRMSFEIRSILNNLMDIEKHYSKKENLFFPYLEKYGITGPTSVMWGKDDEVREFLKSSLGVFSQDAEMTKELLLEYSGFLFKPTCDAILEMIVKEEKILFPMCLDKFTEIEWKEIAGQIEELGYCLISPDVKWLSDEDEEVMKEEYESGRVKFSTGSFTPEELESMINSFPLDITFVDKDDTVKYFSHGSTRIFDRSKAILGRKVQFCHPPSSVHIVEKILSDFKSGKQNEAKFWINFKGMFVHIAYYAVRNPEGEYLGTVEVTQNIAEFKAAEGERRLLTYE
mgnify:CR=1 FL=1